MSLGKAGGIYAGFLGALIVLMMLSASIPSFPGSVAFVAYIAFGFFLNRMVLRQLIEWHPVYNTVQNVASGKLRMLVFWPVTYPSLFFKLGVIKHL